MPRVRFVSAVTAAAVFLHTQPLFAQQIPPFRRGPGFYIAWWKLLLVWLVFLVWIRGGNWISVDCRRFAQNWKVWNPVWLGGFLLGLVLLLWIPIFWVGYSLLWLILVGTMAAYAIPRNAALPPHEKVFTPSHLRFWAAERLALVGIHIAGEKREKTVGSPVEFIPKGGENAQADQAHLLLARQSPGFGTAGQLLLDAFEHRSDAVLLDYTKESVGVRFQIDGVWHPREPMEREHGDPALAVMKTISSLNAEERRQRQQGEFGVKHNGTKYSCSIVTEGTKSGERAMVQLDDGEQQFSRLADIGMWEKAAEALKAEMEKKDGLVLFAAPPGNGLRTTFHCAVSSVDRYIRSFVAVEKAGDKVREVDNIPVTRYDPAKGETPMSVLPRLIRTYPDGFMIRDLVDAETGKLMLGQVHNEKRIVYTTIRAKDTAEAMLRMLMLKLPQAEFAKAVNAVVCQRLIRKLCEDCKEAYEPPPQLLQQLGIPAGHVEELYRPPTEPDKPCRTCLGIGYLERAALFEVVIVNDQMRQVLVKQPKLDVLRQAIKAAKTPSYREQGIRLIAQGVTSIEELKRVLSE